jgi:crotonobetainyl-CoA:carnitine CoA-transferase CaiB-like acyl-CoA transferase
MAGALAGIRVLDLSDGIAGQFCTRMLADFGAEVLLAEPPAGSPMRRAAPLAPDGESLAFRHLNTGKASRIVECGADLLALAAGADAIVIGPETDRLALAAAAPDAVIALVSPFGTDGPWRDWAGCEMIYQAVAGLMHASGDGNREPLYGCGDRASHGAGAAACIAILAGLYARGRWGIGQAASVDIAAAAACMANPFVTQFLYNGLVEPRATRRQPLGLLRCADGWVGFWLHVHLYTPMMAALGLAAEAEDPRFKPAKSRLEHWDAFVALLQDTAAAETADAVLAKLQSARVVAARCYSLTQLRDDCPHLAERGFWESIDTPSGPRPILGPQFRLSATPRPPRTAPPPIGNATGFTGPRRAIPAPAPPPSGTGPLAGLRVVEFTTAWAGPMAGRILAWLGAEVIHVESASRTDSWRMVGQVFNPTRFPADGAGEKPWDRCALFNSQNANKLSLSLELKQPAAKDAMLRILAGADVVLCNFTAGTLDRMGFGHAALKALKPDIIVAEMPAFGSSGPLSHATAIGPSMEMAAGMAGMIGHPGGKPTTTGPTYPDPIGALHGAVAVLTALLHRQHTGQGQHVEVPQVEAAMHFIGEHILAALATGENPQPMGNRVAWAAPHQAFPTAGADQWIAIAATTDAAYRALCAAIDRPDLARHATLAERKENEDAIAAAIAAWAATRDKHEAAALLQSLGIAAAAVHDGSDGARSPYLAARHWFTEVEHADLGRTIQEGLPMALSRTPGRNRSAAPCLGQHTHAILRDLAGLSDQQIAALDAAGATSATPI